MSTKIPRTIQHSALMGALAPLCQLLRVDLQKVGIVNIRHDLVILTYFPEPGEIINGSIEWPQESGESDEVELAIYVQVEDI